MDPTSREDLSALMDGELAVEPTRFLLRRLDHDPELGATWSRWHLIRACLASDSARMTVSRHDSDFSARVAAALQAEAQHPPVRQRRWARYVGGGAIAASVAVAALMLNTPNPRVGAPATVAHSESAPAASAATATALAEAAPAGNQPGTPPWLLSRQPTVLPVQPASANVVYGTGVMQPDYLRRATFARDAVAPFGSSQQIEPQPDLPFSIVLLPPSQPAASSAAPQH
ncbi:MAG TPA: sigma-E factor negative regulatory protein [Rhodanobacteraceae bacterium]|jgi:sigma-E factor negative regulatory protein RseA|nr:sigma-E factor negative regulatory protein [Rhodanobacteraceae bacterium]